MTRVDGYFSLCEIVILVLTSAVHSSDLFVRLWKCSCISDIICVFSTMLVLSSLKIFLIVPHAVLIAFSFLIVGFSRRTFLLVSDLSCLTLRFLQHSL